jgi:hypothetical protein
LQAASRLRADPYFFFAVLFLAAVFLAGAFFAAAFFAGAFFAAAAFVVFLAVLRGAFLTDEVARAAMLFFFAFAFGLAAAFFVVVLALADFVAFFITSLHVEASSPHR